MIPGNDISKWQAALKYDKLAQSGVKFCFIKCTDGLDVLDPFYQAHWAGLKGKVLRGAYHWLQPGQAEAQADRFLKYLEKEPGELPPVCDLEQKGVTAKEAQTFLARLKVGSQRKPIIYTSPYFWGSLLKPDWGAEYYLWQAQYRASWPSFLYPWAGWTFWQWTSQAQLPGRVNLSDKIDLDWFVGSYAELKEL